MFLRPLAITLAAALLFTAATAAKVAVTTSAAPSVTGTHDTDKPDFNYPKTVSDNALLQIEQAERTGNSAAIVQALVQYSLAQSKISNDNAPDILSKISQHASAERRADYKALLLTLQAAVETAYGNTFPNTRANTTHDTLPQDISEWSRNDLRGHVSKLYAQALSLPDSLLAHNISQYPQLISASEPMTPFYPTLLDFVCLQQLNNELTSEHDRSLLLQRWQQLQHGQTAPSIYIALQQARLGGGDMLELYRQHSGTWHSGLLLLNADISVANYNTLLQYTQAYPKSVFTPQITASLRAIERKRAEVSYPEYTDSSSPIEVALTISNLNEVTISVYDVTGRTKEVQPDKLTPVRTYAVRVAEALPYHDHHERITVPPLPYGQYIITASFTANGKTMHPKNVSTYRFMHVSDLASFTTSTRPGAMLAHAVNAITGAPVAGAALYQDGTLFGRTKGDGSIDISTLAARARNHRLQFRLGADTHSAPFFANGTLGNDPKPAQCATLFTDLALYRPGEKLRYSVVAYTTSTDKMAPACSGTRLRVQLFDTNHKEAAEADTLTTDGFGRANGEFTLPTDRLGGNFSLQVTAADGNRHLATQPVAVSEYKMPTFQLTLPDAARSYPEGDDIAIAVSAQAYNGMPLGETTISYTLTRQSWWWWRANDGDDFSLRGQATTASDGTATIRIAADSLHSSVATERLPYLYSLTVEATNAGGETQSAAHRFFTGTHRRLTLPGHIDCASTTTVTLPLQTESSDGATRAFNCHYTLTSPTDTTAIIASGTLSSLSPTMHLSGVRSGTYSLRVQADDDSIAKASATITLYNETDQLSPSPKALWQPQCGRTVTTGGNANITIGTTAATTHIYYVAASRSKLLRHGWLQYKAGLHHLQLPIPKEPNEWITVELHATVAGKHYCELFNVTSEANRHELQIEASAFRNRLVPGQKETWTLRVKDNHGAAQQAAMLLALTDKAIADIVPNAWHFAPSLLQRQSYRLNYNERWGSNSTYSYWDNMPRNVESVPDYCRLQLYGQTFFATRRHFMVMSRSLASANTVMMKSAGIGESVELESSSDKVMDESVSMQATGDGSTQYGDGGNANPADALAQVKLRQSPVKTALWLPSLTTDAQGNISVSIDAPDNCTTWLLQALSYNRAMLTATHTAQVVTAKPIMANANMPRFLRAGDRAVLAATIANNTDTLTAYTAVIELFDPRTDRILATATHSGRLQAMAQEPITISHVIEPDLAMLGLRVKASTGTFGDGEQVMTPVLSAAEPVTEATPFFIDKGQSDFSLPLPAFHSGARLTLEYCDNPLWYCATALPTIFGESNATSTGIAHSLYSLLTAQSIAKARPQIAQAIAYFNSLPHEQSPLTSALQRNADLKTGTLLASPWINEAERQTLRMSSLHQLFDTTACAQTLHTLTSRLGELQQSDGGLAWISYPHCKSSLYATATVLELVGQALSLTNAPKSQSLSNILTKAVAYYDREQLRQLDEARKRNCKNYIHFAPYLYTRSFFHALPLPEAAKSYRKRILDDIVAHWRDTPLTDKAYYAMILQGNNRHKEAAAIVESIRQYSISAPSRGMYWDRLDGAGWGITPANKLSATATILRALRMVDMRQEETEQIRKWILLQKQTNDWGHSSLAAQAVQAIICTEAPASDGTRAELSEGTPAEIAIAGQPIAMTQTQRYTGYCRQQISLDEATGATLSIRRHGATTPAWGAIYCQYAAPVTEIKAQSSGDIAIAKTLCTRVADGRLAPAATLHVGDKVTVVLTIRCGKDMEYVTLDDQRAACLEPCDKTSGHAISDGLWHYREVKDTATRLFLPWLTKGTHVVSYDAYVDRAGSYQAGVATVQCQYAPSATAHTAGTTLTVQPAE